MRYDSVGLTWRRRDRRLGRDVQIDMTGEIPNTTLSGDGDLFREEAARARRFAEAMTDARVIERLHQIAELYDALAVGQDPGPTDRD